MFALVIRTGFLTTKGSLVRDILYPKPLKFEFYTDGLKFVGIMAMIALIGFFGVVPIMVAEDIEVGLIID